MIAVKLYTVQSAVYNEFEHTQLLFIIIHMGQLFKTSMISKPQNFHSKNVSIGNF